jgi:hypothetical protein
MRRAFAMIRRFHLRSGSLLALLLIGLALPMSGCGGCGKSDADKQAEAKQAEQKKKEDEKKKKEKPKPDFEVSLLRVEPADPEKTVSEAKPGHWLSVSRKMIANNFDFVGSLEADVATNFDSRMTPLELERQPFVLASTRGAVLPKGQARYLDQTLFIPRSEHDPWIRDKLNSRGGSPVVDPQAEKLSRMPAYQYYFVVLAREPSRYKLFGRKDALAGPSSNGLLGYYLFNAPHVDKYVPLPSNSLAWTSTAYVLWDDVDPSVLSTEQQQAMLDWLQWGGQLIVSGPDTLALLRGSFLDAYLPATAGKSRSLTSESLSPLTAVVQPTGNSHRILPLEPVRPWSAVALELRPSAHWLPDEHSDLIAEGNIGRGRIVVTAFHLSQRDLINWEGFDTLLNACLLRHPARRYVDSNDLERSSAPVWADQANHKYDARLTCGLRYLTRDIDADGTFSSGGNLISTPQSDDGSTGTIQGGGPFSGPYPVNPPPDFDNSIDQNDGEPTGSGVGGWNDFNGMSAAARESLRSAAGITIPKSNFIAWMLAGYLIVLGPLNWGFFRLLGRIEWAWVAAPVIAILGAVVVTKAAHLNIGFARSQTEIDVVELQPNYSRAHLSRYTALYTSLSTSYDIQFDDPHALVQPFALGGESRLRQAERTVTLHRDADVRLTDFDVSSNSTAMLHSEQMFDVGGGIACISEAGRLRIYNHTKFTLQQSGVVWREPNGDLSSAWIGELPPGSGRLIDFQAVAKDAPALPQLMESPAGQSQADDDAAARLRVTAIASVVENPKGFEPGDMRLIGSLAEPLPGMAVTPASSQATRAGVFVVANLRYAPPPPPKADVNLRPPKNAPAEPAEEPAAGE